VVIRCAVVLAAACLAIGGQVSDPALDPAGKAYSSLQAKDYDAAIGLFLAAVEADPGRAALRKDLAYVYLKIGEREAARDQFAEAVRLVPQDDHAALEYAFLCHETGRTAEAHRVFNQVRKQGDPASRATAEQAFQNVDRPLAEGIERWSKALQSNPRDVHAHRELAMLAENREELPLAAEHYLEAWRLRPEWRYLLVALGRVWLAMGRTEPAHSALLAASRGAEPRAAEEARELLPPRYPYVYEFRQAIELDPSNLELRRELGHLLAAMGKPEEAAKEFAAIPQEPAAPGGEAPPAARKEAMALGDKSYQAGYLRDALKYYTQALEQDPLDFRAMLRLGWTNNVLGRDDQADRWFALARRSPEPAVAAEGNKAHQNLRPFLARFRTTIWLFPNYSSRWRDVFAYGQIKTEYKLGRLPIRAYASARLIGDSRGLSRQVQPQYLSESALIFGAGLATNYWHGLMLWVEAGRAANYLDNHGGIPRMAADYRGGLALSKGFGRLLAGRERGTFFEMNDDAVFLGRFRNDVVFYSQNRWGYTLAPAGALGGLQAQWYWNANAAADLRRQYWANSVETGPGLRFRWKWMPAPWVFSVNVVRGMYTITRDNPWGRWYSDVRVGFWHAFTR
jgi:Tfp pilus assembly protein PilF